MQLDHLARFPFNLDSTALAWVRASFEKLTPDEKISQLFNLRSQGNDPAELERQQRFKPGGLTLHFAPDASDSGEIIGAFNRAAPVPIIVSGDLEGSRMSLPFGTEVPNPLALAAIDDVEATRRISTIISP